MVPIPPPTGLDPRAGLIPAPGTAALECRVTGIVQGVGFRPFVHRLADAHGLRGWVRNEASLVRIVVEGHPGDLEIFLVGLRGHLPPLARLDTLEVVPREVEGFTRFTVRAAAAADPLGRHEIPADVAVCDQCLAELKDPANRRYRYPFITCTDCGPRFTLISGLPYERARTSMQAFTQCATCQAEFESPGNRRFHSETNSCRDCGPRLWLEANGVRWDGEDAIEAATQVLSRGLVVALRGIGGFHLAVDATNESAVRRLRERKQRPEKPFAVMVEDIAEARRLARFTPHAARHLESRERPVVLLRSRGMVAPSVHPGLDEIGLLLPSTALHHLLLASAPGPLVMTSGNLSEEPLVSGLDQARERLGQIADAFLMHDREIVTACDDSVLRPAGTSVMVLRRARGFAPAAASIPVPSPVPVLATGPHLKNTATLVHGSRAWVTPHVGDLETWETARHFNHLVESFESLFHVAPQVVAHDLHPGYLSTTLAEATGLPRVGIQHHHAHVAAVLAEHAVTDDVVGLSFDGTGFGPDGAVWGGEVLIASVWEFRRAGHLRYAPLPGGDAAARAPWRAALGYQGLAPGAEEPFARAFAHVGEDVLEIARHQVRRGINSPPASSMGRLFDAAAAVLGLRSVASYEGQAAMELESAARGTGEILPLPIHDAGEGFELDPLPLLIALGERRAAGHPIDQLAADFHASVARAAVLAARRTADLAGLRIVALSGGSFQNARLARLVVAGLRRAKLRVLIPGAFPPNDGAISYGQAAVAAARLQAGLARVG